jgi:tetratricopeptide (TPR) repeat protein
MNLPENSASAERPEVGPAWALASECARAVLRALAELGPQPVPRHLLLQMGLFTGATDQGDQLDSALDELLRLHLVEYDQERDPWIYAAVRTFVRQVTPDSERLLLPVSNTVVNEMEKCRNGCDIETIRQLDKVVPHAISLVIGEKLRSTEELGLADSLAQHHWNNGRYARAITFFRRAVVKSVETFERGHPSIAMSEANLAVALEKLGHLEEARDILRRVLRSTEQNFEPGHPTIATCQSNLALVLRDLGEFEEARDILRQVVASDEKNFDDDHPSRSDSVRHLAVVLRDLGQIDEARSLLADAHLSLIEQLGPAHPKTRLVALALQSVPGL